MIVTGASRGIGYETAKALLKSGCKIIALARTGRGLQGLAGVTPKLENVKLLPIDLTDSGHDAMIEEAVAEHFKGRIDGLVNNAGILVKKPFKDLTQADFDRAYQVNLWTPIRLLQLLSPSFVKGTHVVNIVTMGSVQGTAQFPGLAAYSSGKAALANLTEALAAEWKGQGIKVNALALGAVQTEMLRTAFPGYKAPLTPAQMGAYIADFALKGADFYNGKILPVSASTP